jgi:hypothetical protein
MVRVERTNVVFSAILAVVSVVGLAEAAEWESLFDGKGLDGWYVRGGFAEYRAEDGAIVGRTVKGSPNTFLCTERDYGDFVLEFEVKCDSVLNSGVQVRSHVRSEGEVFGYQVEIAGGKSGGIWDEARRNRWLYEVKDGSDAAGAYKEGDWNRFRVECAGERIRTWVNDVAVTDVVDMMEMSGFIGLQVHGVGGDPKLEVRWRNIRIKEVGRCVWRPLFDGNGLAGWHALPGGKWEVKDGVLTGTSSSSESRHGLLVSDKVYGDFAARLRFKAVKGNSGFYFRSDEVNIAVGVNGFQAEIAPVADIGGLYETGGRAWVVQPTAEEVQKYFRPGEWNEMSVSARGGHIVVQVNNVTTAELADDPGRAKGHLALQMHGGQDMEVLFEDVEILTEQKSVVREPFDGKDLSGWRVQGGKEVSASKWVVGRAALSNDDAKMLVRAGDGSEMINLASHHGESFDIFSEAKYGDACVEVGVMVPQESNSGVYVMGEYEIQVLDSFGREKIGGGDMGAVYGGAVPRVNASKRPGEWQKYVIDVDAPRYDSAGVKVANMRLVKVMLNGKVLHENLELPGPTPGGVSGREAAKGPLMFQGNHGAVAYRGIRITEFVDAE